ncbi:hypothetical protein ACJJTC_015787 [Scirpophaga incertulas]
MPPKKRQLKQPDLQDVPARMPNRRRMSARRSQNLPAVEERRETQVTPPPSTPRSQDSRMTKPPATKNVEESIQKNTPTPFADTATSFADMAKTEIPTSSKLLPATKTKIPPKTNINVGLPTLEKPSTSHPIPKIIIRPRLNWPELLEMLKEKIGYAIEANVTRGRFIEFSPETEQEYTILWNLLIEDNSEIVKPPSMRPIKKKLYKILPTPTAKLTLIPPPKPPTPTLKPLKTAPREAPPTRTPTPLLSANASRDGSLANTPTPIEQPTDATLISTPTPSMSANELCDDSPTNTRLPTPSRSSFEPSPTRMPTRSPTPAATPTEDSCDASLTDTGSPTPPPRCPARCHGRRAPPLKWAESSEQFPRRIIAARRPSAPYKRLRSTPSPVLSTENVVVSSITSNLPTITLSNKIINEFKNYKLADPNYFLAAPVELLLAGDLFPYIYDGQNILPRQLGLPVAMHSIFGYIIAGQIVSDSDCQTIKASIGLLSATSSIEKIMRSFWETENVPGDVLKNPEDVYVEELFQKEYSRDSTGR